LLNLLTETETNVLASFARRLFAAIHPASREAEAICLLTDRLSEVLRARDLHDERIRVEDATTQL
jgi:hypothetical protein